MHAKVKNNHRQKKMSHFWMTWTKSVRVVQHSRTLLRSWRANSDIKQLLYYSDPSFPGISKIEDVCQYVVAYTGKWHNTTQSEKDAIQNIILKWVLSRTHWQNIHILNILFMIPIHKQTIYSCYEYFAHDSNLNMIPIQTEHKMMTWLVWKQ